MPIDPEIAAQLASDAEQSLSDDGADGTATVIEETPPEADDDSAAADAGETADESETEEEVEEDAVSEEDSEDEDDSDEDDDDTDEDDSEEGKPKDRAQKRIKQLLAQKKQTEEENALLKDLLKSKDGTKAEKKETDEALLEKGYTKEQLQEGKKFLESLGYLPPEKVSELQKTIEKIENNRLVAEDRSELREALQKSKSTLTEEAVLKQVRSWAKHENPKVQARASLDYPAVIRLMAQNKKVVTEPAPTKKKAAPAIPAGGGGPIQVEEKNDDFVWDSGDSIGSTERFLELAAKSLED
jgi:hypothetical protein